MRKLNKWLMGANVLALGVRVVLIVAAALAAGGDPLVALLAALGTEVHPKPSAL